MTAHFVLPTSRAYAVLSAPALAIVAVDTEVEAAMIAGEMPGTFFADLCALLDAFEDGVDA